MKKEESPVTIGRPRAFDVEMALEKALQVFWQKGYEGASLTDLTDAMGINRPSLYAAFGNKEQLFRKALDRYYAGPAAYGCRALQEPTARAVVEAMLQGTIEMLTSPGNPSGCLLVQGALSCGDDVEPIRQELTARRRAGAAALCERLERAVTEGDLPPETNAADLACFVSTVLEGLSVQASSGASRDELQRVIQTALRAWPT